MTLPPSNTMPLLHEMIEEAAAAHADAPYMFFQGRTITYGETVETSHRLARALTGIGVKPGDRVAAMFTNRPELVFLYYACWKLGATMVPLNTRYKRREAAHALEHSGALALIAETKFFPVVEPLCRKDQLHDHTILVDAKANGITEFPDWEDFMAHAAEEVEWPEVTPDTPANINYTSGSTAMPKGVLHTHRSLVNMTRNLIALQGETHLGTSIAFLPLCYIGGLLFHLMNCAYSHRSFVIISEKDIGEYLRSITRYKVTDTILLPTDLITVLEHPDTSTTDWSHMKYALSGGDKVAPDIQHRFHELTGLEISEGYGMTEIGTCLSNDLYGKKHMGTMGHVVGESEAEIRDTEGHVQGNDAIGELWVKTSAMMAEYWNNPQATAETIVDGWLKTGDLASRDADGYYTFCGRSKLIIVRGGSNISPQEVEEVIDHHPAVSSCCIIGVPDAKFGETVKAYVVTHGYPGPAPTEDDIMTYARQRLSQYKCPEAVVFLDEMPYNATGKMDRNGLKQRAAEEA